MLVDEATKYKKSFFLKKKNEQVEPIIDWIKALRARHKIQVDIITCDNAGENMILERESDKKELGIIFEFTALGTPQQNGVVERAFVTVMGRARAMMNHAGFTMAKRQQLWCEAAQTATMLDTILVQESAKSPPFTQFFGVDAKYAKHLRVFLAKCGLWQIQIIKLGGPRLIQEARSVYLLGTHSTYRRCLQTPEP